MIDRLLNIIAPHHCYNCRYKGVVLCSSCSNYINLDSFSYCLLCAHPTSRAAGLCKTCQKVSKLGGAWCVDWREGYLKQLIDDYKFKAVKQAAMPLSELLNQCLPHLGNLTICEVPTADAHVRQLGYDHAKLLAKALAKKQGVNYRPLLQRIDQRTQHFNSRQARQTQAKKLFTPRQAVNGPVLLVDDIVTTGSSLVAASQVLRRAGASQVYAAVLVRQPLD